MVHEMRDYWLNVMSPNLHYDDSCVYDAGSSATTSVVIFSHLLPLAFSVLIFVRFCRMWHWATNQRLCYETEAYYI